MNEIENKLRMERDVKNDIINNASSNRHSASPDANGNSGNGGKSDSSGRKRND
jgi:hypothetical protein